MKTAVVKLWQVANLAPTLANELVKKAGAGETTAKVSYWSGWVLDWTVPGIPVGSALVALGACLVILMKKK